MKMNLKRSIKSMLTDYSPILWILPLSVWLMLVSASLFWNIYTLRQNTIKAFLSEAQTLTEVALSTMLWADQHERVFVPITEWIPMEPFFAQMPFRDVFTKCGLRLAQVSPSAIIYQKSELAWLHGLTRKSIRVTSLQPINPINAPDKWESETLELFENGHTERFSIIENGSDTVLKYMVPIRLISTSLIYPEGYKEGDLIGGLSVREQGSSRFAMNGQQIIIIVATHAAIFLIVAIGLLFLLFRLRVQWISLDQLNCEQKNIIDKLAASEAKLEELSVTDELTGLKNRRGFFLLATQLIREAKRKKTNIWFVFIDVDGMKAVNDNYGHSEGDKALSATANLLKCTFRESDVIARIGGDEFVVILSDIDADNGNAIINRMQVNLDCLNTAAETDYKLSLSAGIVDCSPCDEHCSIESLLKKADELMYKSKLNKAHCRNISKRDTSPIEPA